MHRLTLQNTLRHQGATTLKRCDFCGAENGKAHEEGGRWYISCATCHARGPWATSAAYAVNGWNTRVEDRPALVRWASRIEE